WKIDSRWRLFGDVPSNATLNYSIDPRWNAGFNLSGTYTSYSLSQQGQYFKNNSINTGLFAEYIFHRNLALRLTAAYSVVRKFEVFNDADKHESVFDVIE